MSDILFLCPKYAKKKKFFFGKQRILNLTRYNCGHHSELDFFMSVNKNGISVFFVVAAAAVVLHYENFSFFIMWTKGDRRERQKKRFMQMLTPNYMKKEREKRMKMKICGLNKSHVFVKVCCETFFSLSFY